MTPMYQDFGATTPDLRKVKGSSQRLEGVGGREGNLME